MNLTNALLIGAGGTLLVSMMEKSKTKGLIEQAKGARAATGKPILFISTREGNDFDAWMDPTKVNTETLPYPDKRFAAIVSDSLECVQNPRAALIEWQRVADGVLVNTSSILSPITWLDLKHRYVFVGDNILTNRPGMNWGIAGGIGYYVYEKKKPKPRQKALPSLETIDGTDDDDDVKIEKAPLEDIDDAEFLTETKDEQFEELPSAEEDDLDGLPDGLPDDNPDDNVEPDEVKLKALPAPKSKAIDLSHSEGVETNILHDKVRWRKGTTNLDIGAGMGDGPEGIENIAFAPGILPDEVNAQVIAGLETKPADTVTLANILENIPESDERLGALQVASENVKKGGKVYISTDGKEFMSEIKQIFPEVRKRQGYVVATKR